MAENKVGVVTHYYDQIQVAVVELIGKLCFGETIRFTGSTDFTQKVTSIQVEHNALKEASKGDEVGLKVDQTVKKGDEVFLVES